MKKFKRFSENLEGPVKVWTIPNPVWCSAVFFSQEVNFSKFFVSYESFQISTVKIHNFRVSKLEFGKFLGLKENSNPLNEVQK